MTKYIVMYNIGYGEEAEVIELNNPTETELEDAAYEVWKENAENNAKYSIALLTKDLADNYGEEWK